MTKRDDYRAALRALDDWDAYLLQESGLPGPRGNLELAQAVADEGDLARFQHYLAYFMDLAPVNSPYEFLAFCGALGLGRLLAEGDRQHLVTLRRCAVDPRWRMREAVAMALQRLGDADMPALVAEAQEWSEGNLLEQRAAAAALCEPRLLLDPVHARATLHILDAITGSILRVENRRDTDFLALRKGLGYCWSVAVAALPEDGKPLMDGWLRSADKDIRWIMQENLKKNRLRRIDSTWVDAWQERRA
jgi:hypothetical protein